MHCLRWWLPVFLLPLPAASPFLLVLFIVLYAIRTKPCAYCSVIILGLMFSTCSFYRYTPLSSIIPTQSSTAKEALTIPILNTGTSVVSSPSDDSTAHSPSQTEAFIDLKGSTRERQSKVSGPSSCWIDLSHAGYSRGEGKSIVDMGRWSAPTWRRYPSVLSTGNFEKGKEESTTQPTSSFSWRHFFNEGIFVGFDDIGFRLRLSLE